MRGIGGAGRCAMSSGGETGDRQREEAGDDPGQAEAAAARRDDRRGDPRLRARFRDPPELAAEVARGLPAVLRILREARSRTTRSSAGGDIGWTVEIGGGSSCMIAEISEAWLVPENALLPVAIS